LKSNKSHSYSIWQGVLSALAVLTLWMLGLLLIGLGLLGGLSSGGALNQNLTLFMTAAINLFSGFLVLPSAIYSFFRILGKQPVKIQFPNWLRSPLVWIVLFSVSIGLGSLVASSDWAWLLLPGLHILGIGLPVLWILYLAVRELPLGSLQRRWGVFASGLVLGPGIIIMFEGAALIFVLALIAIWLSGQPALLEQLGSLSDWAITPDLNQEELLSTLAPILLNPWVVGVVLFFTAVIVPLIEELFKPIGVWLLFGKKLTPQAGFAAGALSGAGYALFESLALTIGGDGWAVVVLARIGTAAVHILTSAVTGWALVQAWQKRSYMRLLGAYAFGVILHSLWNGLAVISTFANFSSLVEQPDEWLLMMNWAVYGPYLVGFLALVAVAGLIALNRKFAKL
jgi:hypothetical protein